MKEIRVSASGIIFNEKKVLLVRYKNEKSNFLVGPGGGVFPEEDLFVGLKREIFEETGLHVESEKIILIEDLLSSKYRIIKIWFLCKLIGGKIQDTEEAKIEGITEVGWFGKDELVNETVYPEILKIYDWNELPNCCAQYAPMKNVNF